MKKIEITESNKYLLAALADCPIGTEITFNDGFIEVGKKEFKRGDFITTLDNECTLIYMGKNNDDAVIFQAHYHYKNGLTLKNKIDKGYGYCYDFRHATEEKRQTLIKALNDAGKDWDAEKMEIVDYVWKPKEGDKYYTFSILKDNGLSKYWNTWEDSNDDYLRYYNGLCFRTKELAEEALEVLKNLKHY